MHTHPEKDAWKQDKRKSCKQILENNAKNSQLLFMTEQTKSPQKDAPTYSSEHFTMLSERKVIDSIAAYDNI